MHVSWDRTGWVQIGIDVTVAELRGMLAHAEQEAADAARGNAHGQYATEAHQFRVVSSVLDRTEVNDTVRVLRRARNTAYGADE